MKLPSLKFGLTLLPITWLLTACATQVPVAAPCPKLPAVSKWMTVPSSNAFLTEPSLKTPPKTP